MATLPTLSAVEMQSIKTLICILKPLEYVTKELSGEQYVTISKIIPMVNCLKGQINDINTCTLSLYAMMPVHSTGNDDRSYDKINNSVK